MRSSPTETDEMLAADAQAEAPDAADPTPSPPSSDENAPSSDLTRILTLSVPVSVVLAEQEMTVESILQMCTGNIIEFNVPFDADLQLRVADKTIAKGQAVKTGENFGLRITAIDSVSERVESLGAR